MTLSAVILTKNEKKNIKDCLESVEFADEVIIIDDNSTDSTREIAKRLGAKVYLRDIDKDFSKQSNFGMFKVSGDWILFIDADERVSKDLALEILRIKSQTKKEYNGYFIKRKDFFFGKELKHGETGDVKLLRLVKKGSGKWRRRVHPYFEITGETPSLKNPILHYPHPNLRQFVRSINRWSSWHALANKEEGKKSSVFKLTFWPLGKFLNNYFLKLGFLDGIRGFVHAFMMSFHSFLAWSKLWFLQKER